MDSIKRGNFEFVREIFPELYENLTKAESQSRMDYKETGRQLRDVFEAYCDHLIEENGMTVLEEGDALAAKIRELRSAGKMPSFPRYGYLSMEGRRESGFWDAIWRQFGNACSHRRLLNQKAPAVTYENLLTVFKIIFNVFKWEYTRRRGGKAAGEIGDFQEDLMPIGRSYVVSGKAPVDKAMTNCIREYETCLYNDSGKLQKYGIVRVFDKKSMDEKLLAVRDAEAFNEAAGEAGIQFDGNVQVEVISSIQSSGSDFYIIIYNFSRKPVHLNESVTAELTMSGRMKLCRDIAAILGKFHGLDTPIYHRNLSYDSIYVCTGKQGELEPSIIKLDCAKIVSEEYGTVIQTLENREKMMQQRKLLKYVAPEVRRMTNGQNISIDWEKADIYSLGILFGDILRASFAADPASMAKLQKQGADVRLLQLTEQMINGNPAMRPSADAVLKKLEEIL